MLKRSGAVSGVCGSCGIAVVLWYCGTVATLAGWPERNVRLSLVSPLAPGAALCGAECSHCLHSTLSKV